MSHRCLFLLLMITSFIFFVNSESLSVSNSFHEDDWVIRQPLSDPIARVLHKERYSLRGRADPKNHHRLVIAITQDKKGLSSLLSFVEESSDISSQNFGKHLSFGEVGNLVKNRVATDAVSHWLRENGVTILKTSSHGEYIHASAPVETWEAMLHMEMNEYHLNDVDVNGFSSKKVVMRSSSFSIPRSLDHHIRDIHHLTHLPPSIISFGDTRIIPREEVINLQTVPVETYDPARVNTYITPAALRQIYNISGTGNGYSSQAIYEATGQTFLRSDIIAFQKNLTLCSNGLNSFVGPVPSNDTCRSEPQNCEYASLDIQYVLGIAENVPTTYWYDGSINDFLIDFITSLADDENPSLVYSIGYGAYEDDLSTGSLVTFDTEALKAAARGVTIISAAGNDGVSGFHFRNGLYNIDKCGYYSVWPAGSTYVTVLGGTMNGLSLTGTPEMPASSALGAALTSGGGFSTYTAAPAYQSNTVNAYLSLFTPPPSPNKNYVSTNRAYPDLSMPANNFVTVVNDGYVLVSGTSAACAIFAGMVSLVNAYRLEHGLSSTGLGWINPSIYAAHDKFVLHDFTTGTNNCTANREICCDVGFEAAPGWDPVSGFGSVDFEKFLAYYTGGRSSISTASDSSVEYTCSNRVYPRSSSFSVYGLSTASVVGIVLAVIIVCSALAGGSYYYIFMSKNPIGLGHSSVRDSEGRGGRGLGGTALSKRRFSGIGMSSLSLSKAGGSGHIADDNDDDQLFFENPMVQSNENA